MTYDLAKISVTALMRPAFDAGVALTRLDERIARSPVGQGWIERSHFTDACASLWIDGELVHLEDLALHDATRDIRTLHPRADNRLRRPAHSSAHCWPVARLGTVDRRYSDVAKDLGDHGD